MKFFEHLEGLIAKKIEVTKGIFTLFTLEARLAGHNILPLLMRCGLIVALIFSIWFSGLALLGYLIAVSLHGNVLSALACIFLINLILIKWVFSGIKRNLNQMGFAKTRSVLANSRGNDERTMYPVSTNNDN